MKEFADDNFKFVENGRKLSKRVENTVGKGEIARDEQFLLFPQCFKKACFPEASKVSLCGNGFMPFQKKKIMFAAIRKTDFENTENKKKYIYIF